MRSDEIEIRTGNTETVTDLTARCEAFVRAVVSDDERGDDGGDGLLHVFVPHATAGLAIIETGAGSDEDLLDVLRELLPYDRDWRHRHGSPGHGRDHVLPALLPPWATVPVLGGRIMLGTWQRICLVDTNRDNPRRGVRLSFVPG